MLIRRLLLILLIAFLDHLGLFHGHVAEEAFFDGVVEDLCESLLVSTALHQVQLVVAVRKEPEDVAAGLKQHEVELMREAGLSDGQDHGLLSDFLALLRRHCVVGPLLLAQVEALNQELAPVLLRSAEVVASECVEWVLHLEDFNLQLAPLGSTLQARLVHFDVKLAVREVFLNVDDQLARYLCLIDACCEGAQINVLTTTEFANEATSSLLEVVDQDVPLFDPSLQVVE